MESLVKQLWQQLTRITRRRVRLMQHIAVFAESSCGKTTLPSCFKCVVLAWAAILLPWPLQAADSRDPFPIVQHGKPAATIVTFLSGSGTILDVRDLVRL